MLICHESLIWVFSPTIILIFLFFLQWDEGLLTMSKGETACLEIESDWAYGKKGLPDSKYPLSIFTV